jgi:hypothetical protein
LDPLAEVSVGRDARPLTLVALLSVELATPEARCVDDDVVVVVVSAFDCAVGRQAIATTGTIRVTEIRSCLIFISPHPGG